MKIPDTESPDTILVRIGTDISYRAFEMQKLLNAVQVDLNELLKLADSTHNSNLGVSSLEARRLAEEVEGDILAILEKGRYFTALGQKFCFGPLAPPPLWLGENEEE